MKEQTPPQVSGFQIAFLVIAVLLLAAPADKYLFGRWSWAQEQGLPVTRFAIFMLAIAIFLTLPALRRLCRSLLSQPIPKDKRAEVGIVLVIHVACAFAALGAVVLLAWSRGGEPALARFVGEQAKDAEQMSQALSVGGVLTFLVLAGFIAPVVEEIVFRGMLYRAWAERWGWLAAALSTSFLFAIIHPNMFSQFFASILYIGLYRRTGSLRAPIILHGLFNMLMWYPLAGQFLFPNAARGTGELRYFTLNLVALGVVAVALPFYLWMARDEKSLLRR